MRRRPLGRSELEVPVLCLGAWTFGGWNWGGADDEASVRAVHAAIECGMNAIDTAPVYGFGHSERIVGRAIAGKRDSVIVMTKVGLRWDDDRGVEFFRTPDPDGRMLTVRKNSRPWSVKYEVEQSLKRLGVDVIDLVQVHWPDPSTPIGLTMHALLELRKEGKLRAIGVSNFTVAQMEEAQLALGDVALASDQPQYNFVARAIERDVLPYARRADVGVLVYSPLEQGLLTGKVDAARTFPAGDGRRGRATFSPENRAAVNALLQRVVVPIAERHGATIGQVVLACTIAQPGITSALVGARTPEQVRENARAGELELAAGEVRSVHEAFVSLRLTGLPAYGRRAKLTRFLRRMLGQ